MHVYKQVYEHESKGHGGQKKPSDPPGHGVTHVVSRLMPVLCKSSKHSQPLRHLSSPKGIAFGGRRGWGIGKAYLRILEVNKG